MIHQNKMNHWKPALCAAMAFFAMGAVNGAHAQGASATAAAGDFEARHALDEGKNPNGVTCTLRQPDGKTQFHMGEMIRLEAMLAVNDPKQYRFNIDEANRGAAWSSDTFVVDRDEDAPDALMSYFDPYLASTYGPSPRWRAVENSSFSLTLLLNEWRRFDKPGVYRIYLRTTRLQSQKPYPNEINSLGPLQTTSNAISIEILPADSRWSSQILAKELPAFQSDKHDVAGGEESARIVRFLDTPESVHAILDRYTGYLGKSVGYNTLWYRQAHLGLLESRQRSNIIEWMRSKIQDQNSPISVLFLHDLAEVQAFAKHNNPPTPFSETDRVKRDAWWEERNARSADQNLFLKQDFEDLWKSLPRKRGEAYVQTAYTLFVPWQGVSGADARRKMLAPVLISHFMSLPQDEQSLLLDDNIWPQLRSPRILKALLALYQTPQGVSQYAMKEWRSVIFTRINDLSPAQGRRLIVAELRSQEPRISTEALISLPDSMLPSIDLTLAAHLKKSGDTDTIAPLIARYATRTILPQVKAFYEGKGGKWACEIQSALLAYFLRVDPVYGSAQTKQALALRGDTRCYRTLLSDVSQLTPPSSLSMPPPLQRIAISALNDPDAAVQGDAARALGAYGSPAAEAPLWARLRSLHQPGQKALDDGSLRRVAEALTMSPAWLTDHRQLSEIRSLFLKDQLTNPFWVRTIDCGDQICLAADALGGDGRNETWRVGQYRLTSRADLRRKLAQYPKGTTITLVSSAMPDDSPARQKAFMEVRAFMASLGMRLARGK